VKTEKEFEQWLKRPDIQKKYFPEKAGGITPETWARVEKELHLMSGDDDPSPTPDPQPPGEAKQPAASQRSGDASEDSSTNNQP
jgi:hypothetical protein